ncbi:MAG: hypothetical protein U5L10_05280 [Candidatus Moranbacteria bacterium]|nr:hypothetical protein [Candidatus Moranbacteria bacterium]
MISIQKAKIIYRLMYLVFLLPVLSVMTLFSIRIEEENFLNKAQVNMNQVNAEFSSISEGMNFKEEDIELEKRELARRLRNLESKLFNLEILLFDARKDFSLNYLNPNRYSFENKLTQVRRILLNGRRFARNAEFIIQSDQISEERQAFFEKNKELFSQALQAF